ncbi:CHAT domain-containing protein [Deinococcus gobiensis]|uniref:TIR protein n=1 Tax=Deinococcus gobiensis (strain DSM 21396 / JCM 16679 / CGMCC 1.7299 / I-0) TaxID=745776 RepID=H8H1K0_DEIGI|nr:CHAT domain-containing protein [Deinococcus gobiensis]AFD27397.1 TIR protein [Deinococcus gobiensis I-0]
MLPPILQRRLDELTSRVGNGNFLAYSLQSFYWLLDDPELSPLVKLALEDHKKLNQNFTRSLESHYQEAVWLFNRLDASIEFKDIDRNNCMIQPNVPSPTYQTSRQRGLDIIAGQDLMSGAMPLTAPKIGEDRTKVGSLLTILEKAIIDHINDNPESIDDPDVVDLFLDLAYLTDKQNSLITQAQIRISGLAGNIIETLSRQHAALVGNPQRHASLNERARIMFQIPPHLNAEMSRVRDEVLNGEAPDEDFHRKVLSLWRTLFYDLADRLERKTTSTATTLLEVPHLLLLTANTAEAPLWVDREVKAVQTALWGSTDREALTLQVHPAATGRDFMPQLERYRPHLLHFSGHGDNESLCFINESGDIDAQDNALVVKALRLSQNLRVAVFMSCHSSGLAQAAVEHIDAAIGMNEEVDDADAPIFSAALYQAISQGRHLKDAFDLALLALEVEDGDTHIPNLFTREGIDPKEIYFQRISSKIL